MVGHTAAQLVATLRRSIQVHQGAAGHTYDYSHALSVSGTGIGLSDMVSGANDAASTLTGKGYSTSTLHWKDSVAGQELQDFINLAPNRDIIYVFAHGNSAGPGALASWNMGGINFGTTHPFMLSASCLTGDYTNGDFVETFFDIGGGALIASTQLSPMSVNKACGTGLYGGGLTTQSAGWRFTELKRNYWDNGVYYRFWDVEYNFYGDPKYGGGASARESEQVTEPVAAPPVSLPVNLPDYTLSTVGDIDHVRIPGGTVWLEPGDYETPFYITYVPIPTGTQVQSVALAQKGDLTTAGGLRLPVNVAEITSAPSEPFDAGVEGGPPFNGPPFDGLPFNGLPFGGLDYGWSVVDLPDGGSTLVLRIFPFMYNPLTLRAGYYRSYRFDLTYAQSTAHIAALELEGEEHRLGQPVTVNLALANPGAPRDVVVDLAVRRSVDDEIVSGLLLRKLMGFAGPASFSAVWPAAGMPAGSYQIKARLLDMEGIVLDRRVETFLLGVMAGEIAQFRVEPGHFAIGQPLNLALSFANSGDLPANGLLSIRVYNDAGDLLDELKQDVSNVNPGQTTRFTAQWPTAGRPRGRYNFVANVLLGGPSVGPARASASTELYLYLPVTVK